jgi:glycosyltransferase involved in cell wall biosynthesis
MTIGADHTPLVSVVIPVRNGAATLDSCLYSVRRSTYRNIEIIVVNDHSTDETAGVVKKHGIRLIDATEGSGGNYARNLGAQNARGEMLIFMDADIVIRRETILTIVERLQEGGIDAVVGLYTARHRHETFVSQYKNLWVRYSYLKSPPSIDWLFGAISGIRKDSFDRLGGFDVSLANKQGTEDIELGKRFSRAKMNVVLDIDIEVEHLKNYTFRSFVRNEFTRSVGFAELATKLGETAQSVGRGFANVYPSFVLSTLVSILLLGTLVLTSVEFFPVWSAAAVGGLYILLNIRFLNYLEQVRGLFAMMAMVPILFVDHVVCLAGSVVGILKGVLGRR